MGSLFLRWRARRLTSTRVGLTNPCRARVGRTDHQSRAQAQTFSTWARRASNHPPLANRVPGSGRHTPQARVCRVYQAWASPRPYARVETASPARNPQTPQPRQSVPRSVRVDVHAVDRALTDHWLVLVLVLAPPARRSIWAFAMVRIVRRLACWGLRAQNW